MHIVIIGCGKIGQSLALLLLNEWYITELTLVDIVPNLAKALAEDYRHGAASLNKNVKITGLENAAEIENADLIVVTAGSPRRADQSRRDLAVKNAKIVKNIAERVFKKNEESWYLIVTNPVDAMATLFYKVTESRRVIGSGTHLDTLRFRSEIARRISVGIGKVEGFIAGEHGEAAVPLWSTVRVEGLKLDNFIDGDVELFKREVEKAVKEVAAQIIKYAGATIHGPVHAFRDIIRAVLLNQQRILSIATPYEIEEGEVYISRPTLVGKTLRTAKLEEITEEEYEKIREAAKAVYRTFSQAVENLA
ncbi:MAG: hypothetical protein DRJ37_03055 [Thermoprotei archaeon]|nr:MAG: hypothetical protein DRJ37_03055 [Thermoprotei archaeon]